MDEFDELYQFILEGRRPSQKGIFLKDFLNNTNFDPTQTYTVKELADMVKSDYEEKFSINNPREIELNLNNLRISHPHLFDKINLKVRDAKSRFHGKGEDDPGEKWAGPQHKKDPKQSFFKPDLGSRKPRTGPDYDLDDPWDNNF